MNIIFLGSYPWSLLFLKKLLDSKKVSVVGIATKWNSRKHSKNEPTPVEKYCSQNGLSNILCLYDNLPDIILDKKVEIAISSAYPYKIKNDILSLMPFGGINIHPSLLPRWRGPDPVRRAILNDDQYIGCTIHCLTDEFDEGDILWQEAIPYEGQCCGDILNIIGNECAMSLENVVVSYCTGELKAWPQNGAITYATNLSPTEMIVTRENTCHEIKRIHAAMMPFRNTYFDDSIDTSFFFSEVSLEKKPLPYVKKEVKNGDLWLLPV